MCECDNNNVEKCGCNNDAGCYKPTFKQRWNIFYMQQIQPRVRRYQNFIGIKLYSAILKHFVGDNSYVARFKEEWFSQFEDGHTNPDAHKNLAYETRLLLTMVYALLDRDGDCGSAARDLNKIVHFELLSPLKFDEHEFGVSNSTDGTKQNRRMSGVFKYPDGTIIDIDAIGWHTTSRIDISKPEAEWTAEYYPYSHAHHGTVLAYDEEKKEWLIVWSGQKIDTSIPFDGHHTVDVPCIEIYDPNDKHNDFFVHICKVSDIPQEFYEHYILTDSRSYNKPNRADYTEELNWLVEHHAEEFLNRKAKINFKDYCIAEEDTVNDICNVYFSHTTTRDKFRDALILAGIPASNIKYDLSHKDEYYWNICIYNYSKNKEKIENILNNG